MPSQPALLKFYIGPVQTFIESARTLRDLWSGSYILSWLVVAGLKKARQLGATVFSPHVEDNPILSFVEGRGHIGSETLVPCLPNHFEAEIPDELLSARPLIEAEVVEAVSRAWLDIASAVRKKLDPDFQGSTHVWDRDWDHQVNSFFEIRCVVLPRSDDDFADRLSQLHTLMDAVRAARALPRTSPSADIINGQEYYAVKCSLLGSYEQVGPAGLEQSRQYWEDRNTWGYRGTHLRAGDRFCAISLIKRFAWPCYFHQRLHQPHQELRFSDTATIAAKPIIKGVIDPENIRRQGDPWSGQWLHWRQRQPEADSGEDACPEAIWQTIQMVRSWKRIPTYFVVLMMDGDRLGDWLKGDIEPEPKLSDWPQDSRDRTQFISKRLTHYALAKVGKIVEEHDGELIYCGGDDVLAVLPTVRAIDCAWKLKESYRSSDVMPKNATVSAGLAVAHYKEDLRFAIQQAREAEKDAKQSDRNCMGLRIIRRSGEQSEMVLPWERTIDLQNLVSEFVGTAPYPTSNRWTYQLRTELPTLGGSPGLLRTELGRLLDRLELPDDRRAPFRAFVLQFFDHYRWEFHVRSCVAKLQRALNLGVHKTFEQLVERLESQADRCLALRAFVHDLLPVKLSGRQDTHLQAIEFGEKDRREEQDREKVLSEHFVSLCQAASFLARGRDD